MLRLLPAPVKSALPVILAGLAIMAARLFTFTDWAAANAGLMAILFAWIVADALLLSLIAKSEGNKPALFSVLAVLAATCVIVIVGAAAPVREVYLGLPQVLIAAGATIALFVGWSVLKMVRRYRETGSVSDALETVLPPLQVKFMMAEMRVISIGLLRWNAPADVPCGSRPFIYHTYITPMIATILALQVIELGVVHFLVMLWSPTVAWILFALSVWGIIWTISLLKSFRIYPVLLTESAVRVRSGMIYDFEVPLDAIADIETPFSTEELERKDVLNLALLSSPNVSLRFNRPVAIPTLVGGERMLNGVGLRLDDSAGFLNALKGEA